VHVSPIGRMPERAGAGAAASTLVQRLPDVMESLELLDSPSRTFVKA